MTKHCTKCKRVLSLSEFQENKNYKDGLQSRCKECVSKYQKEKREELKWEAMMIFGGRCNHIENGVRCDKNVFTNLSELHLSHPNGDGNTHRNLISNGQGGQHFYKALKKRNWNTDGFVVEIMCKSHHAMYDNSGKMPSNYGKLGKLSPNYKKGKFNDPVWLKERYVDDKMTQREIADLCGVVQCTIGNRIKEFGINR